MMWESASLYKTDRQCLQRINTEPARCVSQTQRGKWRRTRTIPTGIRIDASGKRDRRERRAGSSGFSFIL